MSQAVVVVVEPDFRSLRKAELEHCALSEWTATGLKPRTTEFLNEHSTSLAKWLSVRLRTQCFWVRVQLQSLHLQISRLLRARSSLTFRQL